MMTYRTLLVICCGTAVLAYLNTLRAGFTFDDNFAVVRTRSAGEEEG